MLIRPDTLLVRLLGLSLHNIPTIHRGWVRVRKSKNFPDSRIHAKTFRIKGVKIVDCPDSL